MPSAHAVLASHPGKSLLTSASSSPLMNTANRTQDLEVEARKLVSDRMPNLGSASWTAVAAPSGRDPLSNPSRHERIQWCLRFQHSNPYGETNGSCQANWVWSPGSSYARCHLSNRPQLRPSPGGPQVPGKISKKTNQMAKLAIVTMAAGVLTLGSVH